MGYLRVIAGDALRALSVLALFFLAFTQQAALPERYGVSLAVTNAIICGADLRGDADDIRSKLKKPFDIGQTASAVALPAPPGLVMPVLRVLGCCVSLRATATLPAGPIIAGGGPRAPPVRTPV